MKFKLVPVLSQMAQLYRLPRNKQRFDTYLQMLQGGEKKDLILPIAGYNPMAKEEVLHKVEYLIALGAENIVEESIDAINASYHKDDLTIEVVLNLADDIGGSWSNYFTTDYSSKFQITALVKRNFCTPFLWTGEEISAALVKQRAEAYMYRTAYWIQYRNPISLEDHLKQEIYVQQKVNRYEPPSKELNYEKAERFFLQHRNVEDYNLIFNFFYGDEASNLLQYSTYGFGKSTGFDFVQNIHNQQSLLAKLGLEV